MKHSLSLFIYYLTYSKIERKFSYQTCRLSSFTKIVVLIVFLIMETIICWGMTTAINICSTFYCWESVQVLRIVGTALCSYYSHFTSSITLNYLITYLTIVILTILMFVETPRTFITAKLSSVRPHKINSLILITARLYFKSRVKFFYILLYNINVPPDKIFQDS